jgi:hypothetical protein
VRRSFRGTDRARTPRLPAIFNTLGILPIVYLAFCQRDKNLKQ